MNRRDERKSSSRRAHALADVSRELQRVNRSLRRLAATPGRIRPEINSDAVREILEARRMRDACFTPGVGDLAWAILLEAFAARLDGRLSAMTSLGAPAGIPRSTAHRWVSLLLRRGLLTRHADPADARSILIGLSDDAAQRIQNYLAKALSVSGWMA